MATITVFPSVMRAAKADSLYLRKVLFAFMPGPHKIAMDRNGVILERYKDAGCSEPIFMWLTLMSETVGFDTVRVDVGNEQTDEAKCLKLCRATNGRHIAFVSSLQDISTPLTANNSVMIDSEEVVLMDKDEAVEYMGGPKVQLYLQNSIIANGSVINSNNCNKNDE